MEENFIKVFTAIGAGVLAATVAILLYILKKKDDELNLVKNKISDEKYKTYFDIISMFFDLLKQDKGIGKISQDQLTARYIDIKKNLFLLGSDEIVKKFTEFDKNLTDYSTDKNLSKIVAWLELFILIRKDSGNPKTKLTTDDILKSIMNEKDYIEIKKMIYKSK